MTLFRKSPKLTQLQNCKMRCYKMSSVSLNTHECKYRLYPLVEVLKAASMDARGINHCNCCVPFFRNPVTTHLFCRMCFEGYVNAA